MNDELPWDDGSHDDPRRGPPADDNHLHQPADDSLPLPDDLRALFEALVEGRITPERAEVLNALLIDNPEVRRQYVHYVQLHSDLIHGGLTHADFGQSELAGGDAARSSPSSNLNAARRLAIRLPLAAKRRRCCRASSRSRWRFPWRWCV